VFRQTQEDLQYYRDTFLSRQGYLVGYETYHLMSFDGGRNWYAAERKCGHVKILGEAEEIYPGLMEKLIGIKRLVDLVDRFGPLNIGDPEHHQILEEAGFELRQL
jgi:hypothetical protein